jgi:hypothetical protein
MRNESPSQRIERHNAGFMVAPDYQQVLARCGIPTWRAIVNAAVVHIDAVDHGIPDRPAALDDSPAHLSSDGTFTTDQQPLIAA